MREGERKNDTACDSEAGLVRNSAKLTGGDNLQPWSRVPESFITRNDATTVKKIIIIKKIKQKKNKLHGSVVYTVTEIKIRNKCLLVHVYRFQCPLIVVFFF